MDNTNPLNSSTTSIGSINSPIDVEKFQKLAVNYQKIKSQNAILKKAILQEQQKTEDLSKDLKVKEQALTTALQEHDVLDFNNQRLTKRITQLQEQMNEKKEGSGWGFGFNKGELQKKEDEINMLKIELQEKIDDNESLHSVTSEKENAFKSIESQLKYQIEEHNQELQEKTKKIEELLQEQKENENKLKQQTQGLRTKIELLEKEQSNLYSSTKLRDDVLIQLNELFKSNIYNLPSITLDYPIENITPSSERFSFESLILDKDYKISLENSKDQLESVVDKNQWTLNIRSIIGNFQSLLSYHLSQVSTLLSSHSSKIKSINDRHQIDISKLNEQINELTLKTEENAFVLRANNEDLSEKEKTIQSLLNDLSMQKDSISQLDNSNKLYEKEIEKEKELYSSTKNKLENEIKTLTNNYENEMKQAKDQHQGLLKHQKHLLNQKLEEKSLLISKLEKSILELKQNNNSNPNSTNNNNNNTLVDLSFLESDSNNNNNNIDDSNNTSHENSLLDIDSISLPRTPSGTDIVVGDEPLPIINNNNENTNTTTTTTATTTATTKSDRFKLTVLDDMGEESDSLNFSQSDKEREMEMRNYYEKKITQLLNKISNIDAKALRYYEQYQQLLKNGKVSDSIQQELDSSKKELKDTKDELEVTRFNYDQQMRVLTEQFISLNENLSQLDTDLIKIKQHKVTCGKCKAWNILEYVFNPENPNLMCSKGHPIQTIQP